MISKEHPTEYIGKVYQDGMVVASARGYKKELVEAETYHYAAVFGQDGPVQVTITRKGKTSERGYAMSDAATTAMSDDTMSDETAMVAEFFKAIGTKHDKDLTVKLILEEAVEVEEALANLLKELCDLVYVLEGAEVDGIDIMDMEPENLERIERLFATYGEVFPESTMKEAFRRVHASNMSKLVAGKPLRREDGKVLKGPNYKAPDLRDLI